MPRILCVGIFPSPDDRRRRHRAWTDRWNQGLPGLQERMGTLTVFCFFKISYATMIPKKKEL